MTTPTTPSCSTCVHWHRDPHLPGWGECGYPDNTERAANRAGKRPRLRFRPESDSGEPGRLFTLANHCCACYLAPPTQPPAS